MRKKKDKANPWSDKAAGKISKIILSVQTKLSNYMNEKLYKVSLKRLKTGLIIFCIVSGGFSVYLAIEAVFAKPIAVEIQPIKVPQHIDQPGESPASDLVGEELYQQVQAYKHWLDSTGEQISPGLRDSIRIIEELYHSQQNK